MTIPARRAALILPAALAVLVGCVNKPQPTNTGKGNGVKPPPEVGTPLYAAAELPRFKDYPAAPEPIASQGVIQFDQKLQVSADVDGRIEVVGSPLPAGSVFDPNDLTMMRHPRNDKMLYRQWKETNPIAKGQTLARIDESQVVIQLESTKLSLAAGIEALEAANEAKKITGDLAKLFRDSKATSKPELAQAEASYAQAQEKFAEVRQNKARYEGEKLVLENKIDQYQVKSPVDGRILKILKFPGEYVKAGEPIMEVQATARFRVEAKVDVQVANRLRPGMPAIVEPAQPFSPEPYTARHRNEVTGVAVTAHKNRPLIVSSSLDSTAMVWDVTGVEKKQRALVHPAGVGVRCVAATGPKALGLYLAATGGSDGKVRIWDLSNPDSIPDAPRDEYEEAHGSAITSIAFSPDGNFLATAAGRDVFVWELAGKKKKYALPSDFRDDVTNVQFTPQCTLVATARDKTIRIFNVGTTGAALERTIEHRSGNVDLLGVSSDGSRMLFDQDATRMDIVSVGKETRTIQTLQNSAGVRFSGLALFSPDDKYALTGAGDAETKGELQLWKLPENASRGSERRRLVTPSRSPITCAAFSPDSGHGFVAVGTSGGGVYYWSAANANSETNELKGVITTITPVDSRSSQVRVEVENASGNATDLLQDRGTATIIIDQTQQAVSRPVVAPKPAAEPAPVKENPAPKPLPLPGVSAKPATVPDPLRPGEVLPVSAVEPVKDTVGNPVPAVRTPPPVGIDPFRTVAPPVRPSADK
jgi:WD40 repeat protein